MKKLGTRHVATISVYVHGEPGEALEEAGNICDEINHKYDCQAKVEQLHQKVDGQLPYKKIDISKLES